MDSTIAYEKKYTNGYGTMHPESHVIRFYEHFLKREFNIDGSDGKNILDFGCGNGTHPLFFASKGFNTYGIDVSKESIRIARDRMKDGNFKVIEHGENISDIFDVDFDIIFANQSLYYLSDEEMKITLKQMDDKLNNNGIVFFTMMGNKNYYYNHIKEDMKDGRHKVVLSGRLNEESCINFIKDQEDMVKKFHMFELYFIGYYDYILRKGSSFHYIFIGRKKIREKL